VRVCTPIHIDPLLGEVFELLHRMTKSVDEALASHAWTAIKKLHQYEDQQRREAASADNRPN
jgi:hypothetical protein